MNGQEIKKIREDLAISQAAFAHILRVSLSTLTRWETDRGKPDAETEKNLEGLSQLLNKEGVEKKKVQEKIETMGIAHAIALAAASGLIFLPTIAVFTRILGPAAVGLASLFIKEKKHK